MDTYNQFNATRRSIIKLGFLFMSGMLPCIRALGDSAKQADIIHDISLFVSQDGIPSALGRKFLRVRAVNKEQVFDSIIAALNTFPDSLKALSLREKIKTMIQSDFEEERFCTIDGWHFSITECRLAAIKTILERESRLELKNKERSKSGWARNTFVEIKKWGPRHTLLAKPFNVQGDGSSAIWVSTTGCDKHLVLFFGSEKLPTTINDSGLISGRLPGSLANDLLNKPGVYEVLLADEENKYLQHVGFFEVVDGAN